MATTIKYKPFKRGDTPAFGFLFNPPYDGFDWSTVLIDGAITAVETPSDNSGAAVVRIGQSPTVLAGNVASFTIQPTITESKALIADTDYSVEVQLIQNSLYVATPITGIVHTLQDFII